MLCRTAAPDVAKQIEQEMKMEVDKEKEKAAVNSEVGGLTDTPSAVMAALKADEFAAVESRNGQGAAPPAITIANKIIKGNKWENWVSTENLLIVAIQPRAIACSVPIEILNITIIPIKITICFLIYAEISPSLRFNSQQAVYLYFLPPSYNLRN